MKTKLTIGELITITSMLFGLFFGAGNLIFADFFFDGFLADVMVQSKIRQAQNKIDDAIDRVDSLLQRLRSYYVCQ